MSRISNADQVLFVDDVKEMLLSIKRGLMDEPYRKYYASSAEEALSVLKVNEISVIVTDLKMPGMGGLELLKIISEKYPAVTRIVLTGYYQVTTILQAINSGHVHRYLTKPWKLDEEFIPTIRQAIEYHQIVVERKTLIEQLTQQNENLKQKNEEILKLKKIAESSDENKTKLLNYFTETILPYIEDVIQATYKFQSISSPVIKKTAGDLLIKGKDILGILKKIERMLKD